MAPTKTKGKAEVVKKAVALERLQVIYAPIGAIRANNYNPNRQSEHDFNLLKRSISEDGFTQPIVAVETEDLELAKTQPYTIVDGEHRWRAAAELGYAELPLAVVPMSLAQARIATLRHNRARGSEDIELATEVLRDLEKLGALDWAADSLQLGDVELQRLLDDIPAPEALAGDEYGEAWIPSSATPNSDEDSGARGTGSNSREEYATPAAVEAQRGREEAMRAAKSDEERQVIASQRRVFRLAVQFADDEAEDVRQVLGTRPAESLLQLCREEVARRAATNGGTG